MHDTPRWYAAITRCSAGFMDQRRRFPEFVAVDQMRADGVEAFAPVLRIMRRAHRHAKQREIAVAPLLPGYCFLRVALPPVREQLARWPHVLGLVKRGLTPATLPADQVAALCALDGTLQPLVGALPYDASGKIASGAAVACRVVKPGDLVTAWSGVTGTVESVHRDKALLLIDMLGGLRRVSVSTCDLELAQPARLAWG